MTLASTQAINVIQNVGFPIAISMLLLWDKITTNGRLVKVVENNNVILQDIKQYMMRK